MNSSPDEPDPKQQPGRTPAEETSRSGSDLPSAPKVSEQARPPRPSSVDTAFVLWLVAAGVGVVRTLVSLIVGDAVQAEIAELTGMNAPQAGAATGVAATVGGLVILAALVAVAFAMRNGRNWARVLLTVLGSLFVLAGVSTMRVMEAYFQAGFLGTVLLLLHLSYAAVVITGIVYQFKGDSNQYFQKLR